MLSKGSRYESAVPFTSAANDDAGFKGLRPRDIGPATGVVEHVVQARKRAELLAREYYNDGRLWWRILDANPDVMFAGELESQEMEGDVILIPKAKE
jgi:nucleoid-associated protein YgaU